MLNILGSMLKTKHPKHSTALQYCFYNFSKNNRDYNNRGQAVMLKNRFIATGRYFHCIIATL